MPEPVSGPHPFDRETWNFDLCLITGILQTKPDASAQKNDKGTFL
jgi:hypothetical protein